jgi:rhodanese-related sulfurtransferase
LPTEGRKLVLHCGSGKRSLMAAHKLQAAGHGHLTHLAGGIQAWKAAGLPVIRIDPQTGSVIEDGRR